MPSLARSLIAVFVGFMVMVIVSKVFFAPILAYTMGRQTGGLSVGYLVAYAACSVCAVFVGGLATAFVAGSKPMQHTAALAVMVFGIGLLSYLHAAGVLPLWYWVTMQIGSPLGALAAGALYGRRRGASFPPEGIIREL